MKAALFYGGKDIRVEEVPIPEPGPGEVLIRVRAGGVCGSDLHGWRRIPPPDAPKVGRESGHELAGEVVALGEGVSGFTVGQRVGIEPEHLVGCGVCPACRRGDTHICPQRGVIRGERHGSHGFSEYDVCVATNVHPLPENVSLDVAPLLDVYGCGVHAVNRAPIRAYTTAVVLGTGPIGMCTGQVVKASGAKRVIMVGTREAPLELAKAVGAADEVVVNSQVDPVKAILDLTGGEGADAVFESVGGRAPTIVQAANMATPGGTICILGIFAEGPQELDTRAGYRKELTITWANSYSYWNGRSEYQIALDLVSSGRVKAEPLITHHFPLERINEAFVAADDKRGSGALKVLVHA